MKKTFIFLVALALALSLGLVMGTPVAADPGPTYYVSTTGSDETGTGTWWNPWETIQHGVGQVSSGDTIQVAPGTYAGAIVNKNVTISGTESGDSVITTGVPYKAGSSLTTAFRLDAGADGAEISDFVINCNQSTSFFFAVFSRGVNDVTVDSLEINDTVQGISNWGGSNWTITNNTITDTVAAGGGGIGIFLGATPPNYRICSDNLVQYNEINASATAEAYSCPGISLALDLRYGAYGALNGTEDISGNQILNNTITASGANNGVGVEVGVIGLDGDPDKIDAIMTAAPIHDNTVQDNTADGADTGIYFYNVTDLTISQNTIKNSVSYGIYADDGQSGTVITGNTFTNNEIQLADETDDTEALDPLDIASILSNNTFDRAVTVDHPGASLLHTIWSSIQDAVDAASAGDTVNVIAGTYDENGLKINKSLTISGTGSVTITGTKGSFDTDLKFHGSYAPGTAVMGSMDYVVGVYNSADVDFVNITIDGANNLSDAGSGQYFAGVAFYNAQGSFSGCEIKRTASNPASCDGAAVSIYIDTDSGTWELEVSNCTFNTWPKNAISAYGSGTTLSNVLTVDVDDSTFTGNDGSGPSDGFQNGVVGLGGLDMEVDNCTFSAISPTAGSYWAAPVIAGYAYKGDSTRYAPAHDLTMNDCTFSVTGDKYVRRSGGVWITTTGTATVSNCTFTNIKGILVDGSNSCDGVPGNFNPSSQDVTISNCAFNGPSFPSSVDYYMCGVNIQRGAQPAIQNCTFSGFHDADNSDGDGVSFCSAHFDPAYYTGSTGGSVTGCTFSDCVLGVYSGTTVTPLAINFNNFDGTNGYGVWNNDAAAIDAENNWWGDASGPYHETTNTLGTGDSVSDNVDYTPWWGANYIGVAHPWEWYTNDSIQDAVGAASAGDTVNVAAGNYTEQLTIDKEVTLNGANAGVNAVTGTRGDESTIDVSGFTGDGIKITANNVAIDGFEIIGIPYGGSGSSNVNPTIAAEANYVTVQNSVFNIAYDDTLGKEAMVARPGTNHISFLNNEVNDYMFGITARGSNWGGSATLPDDGVTDLTVSGNTFNVGYVDTGSQITGEAVQIHYGDGIVVTDNTINGPGTFESCTYDLINSIGITDFMSGYGAAGTITYSNNEVTNCYVGIGTFAGNGEIIGNNVTGNNIGIQVGQNDAVYISTPATGVAITGNDIQNNIRGIWAQNFVLDGLAAHFNNIVGNTEYGVINEDPENDEFDATYNWWGDSSGPYHETFNPEGTGNPVSDNVDFIPWYGDEEMTILEPHSTYKFAYVVPDVIVACEETVVAVTFETDELGYSGYDGVRFSFNATGPGDVIFKATDSEEVEHTFTNSGYWGPPSGFPLPPDYSATTDWTLNFTKPGEYTITFSLIEAPDGEVIAGIEGSEVITVRAEDIQDYYRHLHEPYDEVTTDDLLAAIDDWIADVVPPGFEEPIATLQLLELIDEWLGTG